jgi:hypothetical protein
VRWVVAALVVAAATRVGAYEQKVHVFLSTRAYAGPKTLADGTTAAELRERVWRAGAQARDAELRRRFLARYPDPSRFDAWEWKRFLLLNPDKHVAGVDETPLPAGSDGAAVFAIASRLPDDDERNRERYLHDARRQVVRGADGRPLPEDPATLEMGGLDGLSSQAHAHYGLPHLSFSDDPNVLKTDPRRFAIPPTVHTFGAELADEYTTLAVLASHLQGGERLALVLAGAAAHHIEDVANQIHTVQVGVYEFFVDAKIESIKEELRSIGGLLRPRPSFVSIGIDIITNHHTLLEALFAKHLLADRDPVRALAERAPPDAAFQTDLDKLPTGCVPGFGRAITEALIDRSSYEGAPVYAAIRAVADPSLSRAGHTYPESEDPDRYLKPHADLAHFYELQVRGARRSDQALAAWWSRFDACRGAPAAAADELAEAFVRARLDALDAVEARARNWTPRRPVEIGVTWWVPGLYVVLLALAGWLIARRRRRR